MIARHLSSPEGLARFPNYVDSGGAEILELPLVQTCEEVPRPLALDPNLHDFDDFSRAVGENGRPTEAMRRVDAQRDPEETLCAPYSTIRAVPAGHCHGSPSPDLQTWDRSGLYGFRVLDRFDSSLLEIEI
jgi:hypothetical protein